MKWKATSFIWCALIRISLLIFLNRAEEQRPLLLIQRERERGWGERDRELQCKFQQHEPHGYSCSCLNATFGEWMKNHVKYIGMNNWEKPQWLLGYEKLCSCKKPTAILSLNDSKVSIEAWVEKKINPKKVQDWSDYINYVFPTVPSTHQLQMCEHKFLFIISVVHTKYPMGIVFYFPIFSFIS